MQCLHCQTSFGHNMQVHKNSLTFSPCKNTLGFLATIQSVKNGGKQADIVSL